MIPNDTATIDFLYTNIGRGHPHYLDSIVASLSKERVGRVTDVFGASTGVGCAAWKLVRAIYQAGGSGGLVSSAYSKLREATDYSRSGMSKRVLGRGLARMFADETNPMVVAHPLLTAILKDRVNLFYQHGEIVAPPESLVRGQHSVLLPLSLTADTFLTAGFPTARVFVSGLCIEPGLVSQAELALTRRLRRLLGSDPLCGAFFSSGAEPRAHVKSIVGAAASAVDSGGRALVFAECSGILERHTRRSCAAAGIDLVEVTNLSDQDVETPRVLVCIYDNRRQLNEMTEKLFPMFDYFVAPSHERTNWALGLGLPMFVVDPPLGSYAPLNRQFLLESGVATIIGDSQETARFGEDVGRLQRTGEMQRMAEAGWLRFDIRGFTNIAEMLAGS